MASLGTWPHITRCLGGRKEKMAYTASCEEQDTDTLVCPGVVRTPLAWGGVGLEGPPKKRSGVDVPKISTPHPDHSARDWVPRVGTFKKMVCAVEGETYAFQREERRMWGRNSPAPCNLLRMCPPSPYHSPQTPPRPTNQNKRRLRNGDLRTTPRCPTIQNTPPSPQRRTNTPFS